MIKNIFRMIPHLSFAPGSVREVQLLASMNSSKSIVPEPSLSKTLNKGPIYSLMLLWDWEGADLKSLPAIKVSASPKSSAEASRNWASVIWGKSRSRVVKTPMHYMSCIITFFV